MGLLDIALGNALGGRNSGARGGGGTSPVVQALILALAAKAAQHYFQQRKSGAAQGAGVPPGPAGGGLGSIFGDLLGAPAGGTGMGSLGAGGLGAILGGLAGAGGLGTILDQFRKQGLTEAADSWVARGPNQQVGPAEIETALGSEAIDELERETGMPRQALLAEVAQSLPDAIDSLTPHGRVPTAQELKAIAAG